MGSHHVVIKT